MTITLTRGDILRAEAEALVNTVNCVGVMGRGIALQFKKAFPENYKAYAVACEKEQVRPGSMFIYDLQRLHNPRFIINFPTKRHWKGKSRMEDIAAGLVDLVKEVRARGISSIAIPPLGCGLGGLDWREVRALIEKAFQELPEVHILLFDPKGAPKAEDMARGAGAPHMTPGRAALLGLMRRYLRAAMDPSVTLLEIHKLLYFMQETGEELRLKFVKAPYGPYAENLRHVLNAIEGHFITGYADADDTPDKEIKLNPEAMNKAEAFIQGHEQTFLRFDRVAKLIEGFETPYGMELLSTVHWLATHEKSDSPKDAVAQTYAWNQRKRMFEERHIRIAWDVLESKGWLAGGSAGRIS